MDISTLDFSDRFFRVHFFSELALVKVKVYFEDLHEVQYRATTSSALDYLNSIYKTLTQS